MNAWAKKRMKMVKRYILHPPQGFSELSMLHPYAHLLDIKEDKNDGKAKSEVQEGEPTPVKAHVAKSEAKKQKGDVTRADVAKKTKGQSARENLEVTIVEKQEKIKVTNKGIVLGMAKQVTKPTSDQVQRTPTKSTTSKAKPTGESETDEELVEDLDELPEKLEHSRIITMVMPYSKAKPIVGMSPNFPPKIIWHPRDGDSSAEVLFHHDP